MRLLQELLLAAAPQHERAGFGCRWQPLAGLRELHLLSCMDAALDLRAVLLGLRKAGGDSMAAHRLHCWGAVTGSIENPSIAAST